MSYCSVRSAFVMAGYPPQVHIVFLLALLSPTLSANEDDDGLCNVAETKLWAEIGKPPSTVGLVENLTHSGHYDRLKPPPTADGSPLKVFIKLYFYFLKSYEAHSLFTVYMLLQSRYHDCRLKWKPEEIQLWEIAGTKELSRKVWTPHLYLFNERESTVMGDNRDLLVNIHHDGTVIYSKRLKTTLFCWMKLHKFPFDFQECTLRLDSWSYNMSSMVLEWEEIEPIECRDDLSLTEFSLVGTPIPGTMISSLEIDDDASDDFQGNYTSLTVNFKLKRESGFYVYDYFVPSVMLVVVSWVSFWLEADAVPARVTLGTSTMLTFIILALQTGNSLPKVSYIKASEIWFIVCTAFIFGSLVEFAFVNTIFRSRRKEIALKKVNSKYILKETLTPKVKRKQPSLERSSSCPDDMPGSVFGSTLRADHNQPFKSSLPNIERLESEETIGERPTKSCFSWFFWRPKGTTLTGGGGGNQEPTRMTPQQISHWIDARSRIIFPTTFIIFNVFYWIYVYYI